MEVYKASNKKSPKEFWNGSYRGIEFRIVKDQGGFFAKCWDKKILILNIKSLKDAKKLIADQIDIELGGINI